MRVRRGWTWSLAVVLVAVGLPLGALPLGAAARPARPAAPIEPGLLRLLETGESASFFVEMAVEADLSAAAGMDWQARGEYVWRALSQVAQVTQRPVLDACRARGLACHSLLAGNSVYVTDGTLPATREMAALPGVFGLHLARVYPLVDPVPDPEVFPAGSANGAPTWGLIDTRAVDAWALGVRGQGITVASIDTGVQWDHPALIDGFACPGAPSDPACWADPSNICGPGGACDNVGHGTHVIGTLVAKDDPLLPYIAGMAPDAAWIACKGCETSSCSEFALMVCADWILAPGGEPDNRPQVVNASWGGGGCNPWYKPEVLAWRAAGIVPSFKIGSSGPSCGVVASPGDYQESLASTGHDANRSIAIFGGRGPSCYGHDPYTKPNLSAPAVNICSTYPPNSWICDYSGTAMATAHSSGAAALVLSACPEYIGQVDATFELLQDNADPPPAGNCGAPPDGEGNYTFGYGYLNVLAAIEACRPEGWLHLNKVKLNWRAASPPDYKVVGLVRIHDQGDLPAEGAVVCGEWTYPDGAVVPQTAIQATDLLGRTKFRVKEPQSGLYRLCVTGMTRAGYVYDPAANEDGPCQTVAVGP